MTKEEMELYVEELIKEETLRLVEDLEKKIDPTL